MCINCVIIKTFYFIWYAMQLYFNYYSITYYS